MALKVKPKTLAEFSKPFDHLKAGLSEEKLSLMPCLRTFSNVLF